MKNKTKAAADYVIGDDATIEDADLDQREITYQGKRLTEADVLALDEEIGAGIARREANLVPGGKSLSGDGRHSPVVQTRVSVVTKSRLQAIAEARGMSVSKLSRQVLDEFAERESAALDG